MIRRLPPKYKRQKSLWNPFDVVNRIAAPAQVVARQNRARRESFGCATQIMTPAWEAFTMILECASLPARSLIAVLAFEKFVPSDGARIRTAREPRVLRLVSHGWI